MKRTHFLLLILFAFGIVSLPFIHRLQTNTGQQLPPPDAPPIQSQPARPNEADQKQIKQSPAASSPAVFDTAHQYMLKTEADPQWDWKQPIDFWGKVDDESNAPLANASVRFSWTDLSPMGSSEVNAQSDGNGFFSLTGRHGKRLCVDVDKEGYYGTSSSRQCFEYANPGDGLFKPDQNNPVVFHLRKKGIGVDLITSQYGVKPYFGVAVPLGGESIHVDMVNRKSGKEGDLLLSQIKPEYAKWQQATQWSFKMDIPSGGFIEESDEFPFEAPENGYQPTVEFQFQKETGVWTAILKKNYYIKFGNPARYGRLNIDTSIMREGARLTYAINPTGSRNLEPK